MQEEGNRYLIRDTHVRNIDAGYYDTKICPSKIEGAGLGLFATTRRSRGDCAGEFYGTIVRDDLADYSGIIRKY